MEQLEAEKHELETQNQEIRNSGSTGAGAIPGGKGQDRIVQLEQELTQTRDQLVQSQREVQKLQSQIRNKEVSSTGPVLSKSRSLEVRNFPPFHFWVLSSAFFKWQGTSASNSLKTNEDVTQLQRDLQDCLEREADLREQLKFAEEEVLYFDHLFSNFAPWFYPSKFRLSHWGRNLAASRKKTNRWLCNWKRWPWRKVRMYYRMSYY